MRSVLELTLLKETVLNRMVFISHLKSLFKRVSLYSSIMVSRGVMSLGHNLSKHGEGWGECQWVCAPRQNSEEVGAGNAGVLPKPGTQKQSPAAAASATAACSACLSCSYSTWLLQLKEQH